MSKSKRKNKSLQKSVVDSEIDLTRKELSRKLKIENEAHNSKSKGEVNETLDQKLNDLCLESGTAVANKELHLLHEPEIPKGVLYYGWFFSEEVNITLKQLSNFYLSECLKVPSFERFLKTQCNILDERDAYDFYRTPRKKKASDKLKYHVTAKFLDRLPNLEYQTLAQKYAEKVFRIHLNGLFFTSMTHGFRVRLSDAQRLLFDEREGLEQEFSKVQQFKSETVERTNSTAIDKELAKTLPKTKSVSCTTKIHNLISNTPVSTTNTPVSLCNGSRSRAHVTIGCGPRVKPIQSGRDLLDIADLENRLGSTAIFHKDYPIDGGTLRQFGKDPTAFVIYPCHEFYAEAIFKPFISN